MSIVIHYSDDDIVVVSKPSMLLSVPGRGPDKQDCVVSRLVGQFPDIRIVHRLDWETSGLLVLARNREAHRELSRQFEAREVHKTYTAVVYGELETDQGKVDAPMRCDWPNRPRQIVDHDQGKPSLTYWQKLSSTANSSRVLLTPITGRSHQLRVHLQSIGHPILGDQLYAHDEAYLMADRLQLHATNLSFNHPVRGETVEFHSTVPF